MLARLLGAARRCPGGVRGGEAAMEGLVGIQLSDDSLERHVGCLSGRLPRALRVRVPAELCSDGSSGVISIRPIGASSTMAAAGAAH